MNAKTFQAIGKSIKVYATKHAPGILTGIGISGFITTIGMTVRIAPQAKAAVEDAEYYASKYDDKPITTGDKVKIYAKYYLPIVLTSGMSATCIIMGNRTQSKRNAALAAAYSLSEATLKEYQQTVLEEVGEKKETKIRDKIAQKSLDKTPVEDSAVIFTGNGDVLCFDKYSGRYFMSSIESIRTVCNDLSRQLLSDMFVSLNEFYTAIGLDEIPLGGDVGWDVETGLVEPYFSTQLDKKGHPCVVIDYMVVPTPYSFR